MNSLLPIAALCGIAAASSAQAFNWTLASTPTAPSARERTATGTDGSNYYMYGGQVGANVFGYDELWSYDGTDWSLLSPSGSAGPGTRRGAIGAFDVARGKFVVFSGQDTNGVVGQRANDTWEWDPVNGWVDVTPSSGSPDGRWLTNNGAYVPGLGVVFHGGNARDAAGNNYRSNETWAWVGGAWALLSSGGPAVQNAMMVYRGLQNDLILHGGQTTDPATGGTALVGETWRLDLTTFVWTQLVTGGTTPFSSANSAQGLFASMCYYNPLTGNVVVHGGNGGSSSASTWQFDGASWSEISTNGVGCRNGGMHWIDTLGAAVYGPCNEANGARNNTRTHGPQVSAAAAAYGAGCAGLGGQPLSLVADNDPWVGLTFGATCANLSPAAPVKVAIWGFASASAPITGVLGAGPGCLLLNSADLIQPAVSPTATYSVSLPIPASPTLAGAALQLQVAELDPTPSNLATSNGLSITVGG
ncbi:MAG: hypothetical protein VX044_09840 [Planctomycetota bacterium]|nr:hypothetical protein [Planctomycetota bacterium]